MRDRFVIGQRVKLVRPKDPQDKGVIGTILSPRQVLPASNGEYWLGYIVQWDDNRGPHGAAEDRLEPLMS
jgi:hypothetical protein